MEQLFNGYSLDTPAGTFPLSTDSMVLADFVSLPKQASVLDLGSGCGTLGTLLCAKDPACRVTGVELDETAHNAAIQNIQRNALEDRMESICADLRTISSRFAPGSYAVCISNPPYFSGGFSSSTVPLARQDNTCSIADLFTTAGWALQYGGDFYLVHKPEKLAQLMHHAVSAQLEPKRLRLVRHRSGSSVAMILLQCRKGGKPGLVWDEICLYDDAGLPTEAYKQIYHL